MSHLKELSAQFEASASRVAKIDSFPSGRLDSVPDIREFFQVADALARVSRLGDASDGVYERFFENSSEQAQLLWIVGVDERREDRFILETGDPNLRVKRLVFSGMPDLTVDELGVRLRSTPGGAILIEPDNENAEPVLQSFAGEVQILAGTDTDAVVALAAVMEEKGQGRERNSYGLQGASAQMYEFGVRIRGAWGSATVTITAERVIAVVFTPEISGRPDSKEDAWVPSFGLSNDVSSVLLVSVARTALSDWDLMAEGFVARRTPYVSFQLENASLDVQAIRPFMNGVLVRKKDVVADALRKFLDG